MRRFLVSVFGRRVAVIYGGVSLLAAGVLASIYMTSAYAVRAYVVDQMSRLPWDISVVQRAETHAYPVLQQQYRSVPGVQRVDAFGFLRVRALSPLRLQVDGRDVRARWLGIMAASRADLLPSQLRSADDQGIRVGIVGTPRDGGDADSGSAPRIRVGSVLRLLSTGESHDAGEHEHSATLSGAQLTVLELTVGEAPTQLERQEFNKWMLRDIGSMSYLPEEAVIVAVPFSVFEQISQTFGRMFLSSEGIHGGDAAPPYVPEIIHLISIDRATRVSPWNLDDSLARIAPLARQMYDAAQWLTPYSYVSSDLHAVLARMSAINRIVGVLTVLLAIPLLWLVWVLGKILSGVLILNERRLIGLGLVRGIPIEEIGRALNVALLCGSVAGGVLGLLLGVGLPIAGRALAGQAPPPASLLAREGMFFAVFLVVASALALVSGRSMVRRLRRLTPREVIARVTAPEGDVSVSSASRFHVLVLVAALFLGSYKLASWLVGYSVGSRLLGTFLSVNTLSAIEIVEAVLNFVAIPLFLFGVSGILLQRVELIRKGIGSVAAPLAGSLTWFMKQHIVLGRQRVAYMLFIVGLAVSLALLPQVAADTFYGRVLRGVQTSMGGNLHLEFDLAGSDEGSIERRMSDHWSQIETRLHDIENALSRQPSIAAVSTMAQFVIPGVYVPGQSGLTLDVIEEPESYMDTAYYEDTLGVTRPFSTIIESLGGRTLTASQGLLRIRAIPFHKDMTLGYASGGGPIRVQFGDAISFLPGQPAAGVSQREGYVAAEIDYLNHILRADARIFTTRDRVLAEPLRQLNVLPSRAVVIARTAAPLQTTDQVRDILAQLPVQPREVRWEGAERQRVARDMFISLALENMTVFRIGGLVLALAGIAAIGLVNFMAERRTFALLRLRGVDASAIVRLSLSMFLAPVVVGIFAGAALAALAGYGLSQAIWDLPRVHGVAGLLTNRLVLSVAAWKTAAVLSAVLCVVALAFALWPLRQTARDAIREN